GVLIVILLSTEALENTSYYLFLKPFETPIELDENIWMDRVVLNRVGVAVLGVLFIFLALRRMEERERLL
ncbi:MAG: hypothetical protein QGG64_19695, partial [Candidatus Latescibacteria bacterium]|nr:hypothetical protein [Candidatus Latescibacterota bacterium]